MRGSLTLTTESRFYSSTHTVFVACGPNVTSVLSAVSQEERMVVRLPGTTVQHCKAQLKCVLL
jgi:hypothetical protein